MKTKKGKRRYYRLRYAALSIWVILVSILGYLIFAGTDVQKPFFIFMILAFLVIIFIETATNRQIKDFCESYELLRLVIGSMGDIVCIRDLNGRILFSNPRFEKLNSFQKISRDKDSSALSTGHVSDKVPEASILFSDKGDERIWKDKCPRAEHETVFLPDGSKKLFNILKFPVFDENGVKYILTAAYDSTKKNCQDTSIKDTLDFMKMVIGIANTFINVTLADLDATIDRSLAMVGSWLGADRAYIFSYDFKDSTTSNTHEWCAKGVSPQIERLQSLPLDMALDWVENHRKGKHLQITSVRNMPEDSKVKQLLESQDIKSIITLPLMDKEECMGFVGFDLVRGEKRWHENDVALLKIVADIYANAEIFRRTERERERIKKEVEQSLRFESIGRLAGGVAHDLNNMLVPILGYSELALNSTSIDKIKEFARQILEAGERAKGIVQQLLTISSKQAIDKEIVDINELINSMTEFFRYTVGDDITLNLDLTPSKTMLMANPGQLEQVIMNLVVNARDSISNKGAITIQTETVPWEKTHLSLMSSDTHLIHGYHSRANKSEAGLSQTGHDPVSERKTVKDGEESQTGSAVILRVKDTGCGMDREIMDHIFEPFFTTKGDKKGTGLGLSTVYGIVRSHKGKIDVHSRLGKGTTFTITFPGIEQGSVSEENGEEKEEISLQGRETILIVEDNEQVRNITASMLELYGYRVITAKNGEDAINLLKSKHVQLDLLLTDVVMPGIDGHRLVEHVTRFVPDLKVLYMSGYTKNILSCSDLSRKGIGFIQKPFNAEDLASKVKEIIRPRTVH